jgi:hypothetical protein
MGITVITSSHLSAWIIPATARNFLYWWTVVCYRPKFLLKATFSCWQRPALIPFHALELKLTDGEGNWELCSIRQWVMPHLSGWADATICAVSCMYKSKQLSHRHLHMVVWIDSGSVGVPKDNHILAKICLA